MDSIFATVLSFCQDLSVGGYFFTFLRYKKLVFGFERLIFGWERLLLECNRLSFANERLILGFEG